MTTFVVLAIIAAIGIQAKAEEPEAISLLGKPLYAPHIGGEALEKLESDLAKAREEYHANSASVDAAVWVGRRIAYLGRYRESIKWYTDALEKHGRDPKLLRHRGHRYITIRKFNEAIADFEEAGRLVRGKHDEIEPDGVPNEKNIPISSLHSNIWYHLALAFYLKGDFKKAIVAADKGMIVSDNPDRFVSQTYWRYLILRRLGQEEEAKKALEPIHEKMELIENREYLNLLLVFKGIFTDFDAILRSDPRLSDPPSKIPVRSATTAFGLGAFHLISGDRKLADERLTMAVENETWASFGVIAAEAELARLK